MRHCVISDKLFKIKIHIFVCSATDFRRYAKRMWHDNDPTTPSDDAWGMWIFYDLSTHRQRYVIWFENMPGIGDIVHETHHATLHILDYMEVPVLRKRFHTSIDEVSARYQSWLVEEIMQKLKITTSIKPTPSQLAIAERSS